MKSRLLAFFVLSPLLSAFSAHAEMTPDAAAPGQPLTGTFSIPAAAASTPTVAEPIAENSLLAEDDASAGLADTRLRAAQNAPLLSIVDVLALTLQNNPQRKAAWAAVEAARARIKTAKSAGGPQVDLSVGASTQRAYGPVSSGGIGASGGAAGSPFGLAVPGGGPYNSETASINATLPIYTGGRVSAGKRVAQFSAQAQEAQARSVEQDLVYNTAIAYLNVLRGEQLLEVGNSNLDVARERRRVAQVRFDAGAAAHLEVSRAETDLANARQTRIAASNALGQSLSALNTLMGRAPAQPLRVEPITSLSLPSEIAITGNAQPLGTTADTSTSTAGSTPIAGAVTGAGAAAGAVAPASGSAPGVARAGTITAAPAAQLQSAANQGRQSLAVTKAQIKAAEASVDLARAAKKPSIGLDILGLIRNPVTFAGRFLLSLGGSLAQNLFDSGRTRAQVKEAQAVLHQLQFQRTGQEQAIANDIEQSLLLLDSAQKRLASSDTGVLSALDALNSAQLGYEAGASTALEVSDAQAALLTAQTEAVNARFDVAAAQARLAAATGVLPAEAKAAYAVLAQQAPHEK
jgi:outer membrane protein TolC